MCQLIKFVLILGSIVLFLSTTTALAQVQFPWQESKQDIDKSQRFQRMRAVSIFRADGSIYGPVEEGPRRMRYPIMVMDTVRMEDGIGTLVLNHRVLSRRNIHNVSGSQALSILPSAFGYLADTSETVNYYSCVVSLSADTIWIKSSQTDDSGKVIVEALVR